MIIYRAILTIFPLVLGKLEFSKKFKIRCFWVLIFCYIHTKNKNIYKLEQKNLNKKSVYVPSCNYCFWNIVSNFMEN